LRAKQLAPDDAEIAEELRQVRQILHELFSRIEDLEQRAAILSRNASLWVDLGHALNRVGRDDEALAAYDHALEADPDEVIALVPKGIQLNTMGRYEEALDIFVHLRELEPDWSLPWTMTGMTLCNLRRYSDALPYLERAVTLDAGDTSAWSMMRLALEALGRADEVREVRAREREARLASGMPESMSCD
jgi:tetratricopeptide (TPR) repeat protein